MDGAQFIALQLEAQEKTRNEQDAQLDAVRDGVVRIKDIAGGMGGELDAQHRMLNTMEGSVDRTKGLLHRANHQMKALLTSGDTWKYFLIAMLALIVVGMIITLVSMR